MKKINSLLFSFCLTLGCLSSMAATGNGVATVKGKLGNYPGKMVKINYYVSRDSVGRDSVPVSANGEFVYTTTLDSAATRYFITDYPGENGNPRFFPCYLLPGSTLNVSIKGNGDYVPQFKGKTAAENSYVNLMPKYDYKFTTADGKLIPFTDFKQQINAEVEKRKEALKGTSAEFRERREKELGFLPVTWYFIYESQAQRYGVDTSKDPEYMKFINGIDLNADDGIAINPMNALNPTASQKVRYILAHNPGLYKDEPEVARYFCLVRDSISNPKVRAALGDNEMYMCLQMGGGQDGLNRAFEVYRQLSSTSDAFKNNEKVFKSLGSLTPGTPASDFVMDDINDTQIHFRDIIKGKVTYVDFWATWCGPCRAETPYFKKMAEEFKDNANIQFVSISLDNNRKAWKAMLADEKPFWQQYIITDNFNSEFAKKYNVVAIPRFMLFDKNGRIISINAPRPSDEKEFKDLIADYLK